MHTTGSQEKGDIQKHSETWIHCSTKAVILNGIGKGDNISEYSVQKNMFKRIICQLLNMQGTLFDEINLKNPVTAIRANFSIRYSDSA